MLTAAGIIAEFNPLHNGHRYLIKRTRQATNADVIAIVMSGNWTQRGVPAIVDKWQRTRMALAAGADLVIELPVQFAVQPADIFAGHAVELIDQLNCKWLAFGCEHPDFNFDRLASIKIKNNHYAFQDYRKTYATLIRRNFYRQTGIKITQPNDLLALSYARAKRKLHTDFTLLPVLRSSAHHGIDSKPKHNFVNSTTIRWQLLNGKRLNSVRGLPVISQNLMQRPWFNWDSFWPWLRYRIIESSLNDLRTVYEMREGLEHRFKRAAVQSVTFRSFIRSLKTKRYTYSTLLRLCFYVLIDFTEASARYVDESPYLRILGFDQQGRKYLGQIKKQVKIPIITNVTKDALDRYLQWDFKSGMLFEMKSHRYEDLYRHPVIE